MVVILPHEKSGLWSAFVNLLTGAIGVGILSFPYAFKSAGLVGITVLGLLFAALNAYTLWLLARYAHRHAAHLVSHPTYESLVRRVLGPRAYAVVEACILFNTVGALSAFLIVVGDLGHVVLEEWLHSTSVPDFFYSKTCVVLVFCFCVALPLSLFPHIHDLSFSSFLAVASVFVVAGMVIARGIESCVDGRMADGQRQEDAVVVFNLQFDFFLAVPLVVFSLGCHLQVVPVYHSLKREKKPWLGPTLVASVMTCICVYLATGVMGYLRFGNDSQGDILGNFPVSDIMLDVGKLLMAAHISLAYPVNLYPCTKSVQLLLTLLPIPFFKPKEEGKEGVKESRWRAVVSHWAITLCLMGLTAGLAILVPNIQIVFGLIGSTTAVVLNFITPALMLLVSPLSLPYEDTALLGINPDADEEVRISLSFTTNEADDDRYHHHHGRHHLLRESSAASTSTSTSDRAPLLLVHRPTPPSRNICATAAIERVVAVSIISLALLIAICGTGVNIYQNFF